MSKTVTINGTESKTLITALFIAANIGLPHLFHLIPGGGIMFLPIYFFTAFAAVSYGKWTGIFTGVMSPLAGFLIFDAPKAFMIPDMILKGVLLSAFVAYFLSVVKRNAKRFNNQMIAQLVAIPVAVLVAWLTAGYLEMTMVEFRVAFQDFFTGIPGLVMMTIGGWLALFFNRRLSM